MRVFKTKEFARYTRHEDITDDRLCEAVQRATRGLIDADLGGGLIKQRVARPGQGRRGGYRTLMAFSSQTRTVFVHGFAKSERDNIDPDELQFWRRLAAAFLTMTDAQLAAMVNAGEITEVTCHE
ncbi:type II toxin-antitoxin system RelE/ParE family toxin [Telmatospirillum sp.]|uniref:type II toxin-antitoxin system RelE/ParE family toxin n=1 Tax=Telmatospirillum sp. TaxID=2079197 RepID=UPI00283E4C20|nr:type II toxin-antitoxin system RelE/ParE family toxin [Telmatospirillum sp.]MDR3439031.1 type II toxin-antitoxin system RelE/ParE family toxin [Telmatospirillum sp.]